MICRRIGLTTIAIELMAAFAWGQLTPPLTPPPSAPSREEAMDILNYGGPRVTFGGNIVFQFPNYDIALGGTPEYAGLGNGRLRADPADPGSVEQVSSRVIYKSPNGSWDGSNFLLHPAYDYSYANNFYRNRFIASGRDEPIEEPGTSLRSPGAYPVWTARFNPPSLGDVVDDTADTGYLPPQRMAKSPETINRLYQTTPSFRYAPTPLPPKRPSVPGKANDALAEQPKQLLWQLDADRSASTKSWAVRQVESTLRSRRSTVRRNSTSATVPQRLSPEPDEEASVERKSDRSDRNKRNDR